MWFPIGLILVLAGGVAEMPKINVIAGGESVAKAADCRRMLVGPGVNQPDHFPGYDGFVGWQAPLRLKNGTWLVAFSAGYWHASVPTPLHVEKSILEEWIRIGMRTDIDAPTGGRAMITRSNDEGMTWSKPVTLIDTPADDRHPNLAQLRDGTVLATFFTYPGNGDFVNDPTVRSRTTILRSKDGGKTWDKKPIYPPSPFLADAADGPIVVLKDGSAVLVTYGGSAIGVPEQVAVFRSTDTGKTWKLQSVLKTDHEMSEPTVAQLPDGRLVLMTRPEGDIAWSDDLGKTWTKPASLGMRIFEPGLIALQDGTLLCIHGSYGGGGLRAIFSTDGGKTWVAPDPIYGFAVDSSVYGYGKGVELPDGSVFVVYINTGGHATKDAQTEAIWGVRFRVRPDHSGIDILPAPGR